VDGLIENAYGFSGRFRHILKSHLPPNCCAGLHTNASVGDHVDKQNQLQAQQVPRGSSVFLFRSGAGIGRRGHFKAASRKLKEFASRKGRGGLQTRSPYFRERGFLSRWGLESTFSADKAIRPTFCASCAFLRLFFSRLSRFPSKTPLRPWRSLRLIHFVQKLSMRRCFLAVQFWHRP
jgi:hypothetical protein